MWLLWISLPCSLHQHFFFLLLRFSSSSTEEELSKVNTALQSKNSEEAKLRSKSEGLETKCTRLREYIRKLTSKCEEWEASYDRQSMVLDKLHTRNGKSKQKAAELAHRYKKLAGDIQRKSKVRNLLVSLWVRALSSSSIH
jgi:septal ring factor EnvC (AmiA/AmiB activator)